MNSKHVDLDIVFTWMFISIIMWWVLVMILITLKLDIRQKTVDVNTTVTATQEPMRCVTYGYEQEYYVTEYDIVGEEVIDTEHGRIFQVLKCSSLKDK